MRAGPKTKILQDGPEISARLTPLLYTILVQSYIAYSTVTVVFCIGLQTVLSASHAIFVEYFQKISIIPLFPSPYCAFTYCVVQVYNVQESEE